MTNASMNQATAIPAPAEQIGPENSEITNNGESAGATPNSATPNIRASIRRATHVIIHTSAFNAHAQLFYVVFRNVALAYARFLPPIVRRLIEFFLLIASCICLFLLIYIHLMFVRSPLTCLDHLKPIDTHGPEVDYCKVGSQDCSFFEVNQYYDVTKPAPNERWPRSGILRVEILPNVAPGFSLADSYAYEYPSYAKEMENSSEPITSDESWNSYVSTMFTDLVDQGKEAWREFLNSVVYIYKTEPEEDLRKDLMKSWNSLQEFFYRAFLALCGRSDALVATSSLPSNRFVMEYSLEHGFLRLSPQMRERLNISVKYVVLNPYTHKCFGNWFTHFMLDEFLGYNDILIGSLKRLAEPESTKGYVRNVVDGSLYRFVKMSNSHTSYISALFAMIMFTFSVSVLLRYSHHQIFLIINDMLRMLEANVGFTVPAAPLMTLIFALIAVETIMSEFFSDSFTAFYVIIIVSLADHFEAVCCHSPISKRFWPCFFFMYHFAFYAYNYRFYGQYSNLALMCSWLFTQHSMVFFFHHYDLPFLMHGLHFNGEAEAANEPVPVSAERVPPASRTQTMEANRPVASDTIENE